MIRLFKKGAMQIMFIIHGYKINKRFNFNGGKINE